MLSVEKLNMASGTREDYLKYRSIGLLEFITDSYRPLSRLACLHDLRSVQHGQSMRHSTRVVKRYFRLEPNYF